MYTLLFQAIDTIAASASLASGATSTTLTNGNFATPSGTQIYVIDYDIPGSAEIVTASVAGTAMTSITRGLSGGAAGTTNHAAGAKVGAFFVPQHYDALVQGTGFATGTSSIGIPQAAMRQEAGTAWTPVYTGCASSPTTTAKYQRYGNMVFVDLNVSAVGTSNATTKYITLPFAAKRDSYALCAAGMDNGSNLASPPQVFLAAGSVTAQLFKDVSGAAWTSAGTPNWFVKFTFWYECQ